MKYTRLALIALSFTVLAACDTTNSRSRNPAVPEGSTTGNTQRITNQSGHTDAAPLSQPR